MRLLPGVELPMKTILVTGPIGSGKSEVCRILSSEGYAVYDADSRTKALYGNVPGLKKRIEEELGIPFNELGIIFTDERRRNKLEDIVYPLVLEDMEKWVDSHKDDDNYSKDLIFIESAVALTKPIFDHLYDEVWIVDAPLELRTLRNTKAAERDGLQSFPSNDKISRIIYNDSTLDNLYKQIWKKQI